jgi:hypothetical protein
MSPACFTARRHGAVATRWLTNLLWQQVADQWLGFLTQIGSLFGMTLQSYSGPKPAFVRC